MARQRREKELRAGNGVNQSLSEKDVLLAVGTGMGTGLGMGC